MGEESNRSPCTKEMMFKQLNHSKRAGKFDASCINLFLICMLQQIAVALLVGFAAGCMRRWGCSFTTSARGRAGNVLAF